MKNLPFTCRILLLCLFVGIAVPAFSQPTDNELKLWYTKPAKNWNEALPIGNGRLGAMIFGGIAEERIQLNEESVWSGKKNDFINPAASKSLFAVRRLLFEGKYTEAQELAQKNLMGDKKIASSYQTLGDLNITFPDSLNVSNYVRELDLETAVAKVSYNIGSVSFTREIFSSAVDQAIVVRITSNKPGSVSFGLALSRPGDNASVEIKDNEMAMREHVGNGVGVKMVTRLKVLHTGGTLKSTKKTINVSAADEVILLLSASTDYWGKNPEIESQLHLNGVGSKKYDDLKQDHIRDYQQYFNRLKLDLGEDGFDLPTDERLEALRKGQVDPGLIELYYQYGRYLLISSSRPGGLPANLQGIWADGLNPPWDADYHININIQMNYWPAEVTNLSELHLPFIEFLNAMRPDARKTAKEMYGIDGAVSHFTTDAWHFTEPYGKTQWAMWPMGMAWSAQHAWEHFLFTEDVGFLQRLGYPIMRDAAEFCLNWLVRHPQTGKLVSGPSISPENTFKTKGGDVATMVMGPTMDHMIIRHLFTNTIEAGKRLDIDAAFRKKMEKALSKLAPTTIGSDGRIMEWTEEFEEPEPGHRHISHLYGLHPGNEITNQKNTVLLEAARKTIEYRLSNGGGHTGWSRAWIINFFARLQDEKSAYENLLALLQKSTLPNLFDTHPPFQIDGNFGATAGITEMLIQSHANEIHILPALPKPWDEGYVHGVCARGGFKLDITWNDSKLVNLLVRSKVGNPCTLRYGDKVINLNTEKGKTYELNGNLDIVH
ncbi:MAG TPA: glycoside hydrolase family 95 protein [Ohtaekwangia sp.]|nr:glycoside hydrolase family 95 protein [Ohtaekwangia sp.]